jgi:hypothetical protein
VKQDFQKRINFLNFQLKSIGRLEPDQNVAHTKAICAFFNQELGLPPARVLIHFENLETHEVGYQGTTVKALMG